MSSHPSQPRFLRTAADLARRYFDHGVARDSAALTYYLLFALFPTLIFFSNLVGLLSADAQGLLRELSAVVPQEVSAFLEQYLAYVSETSSRTLLWFSLVFSVYFPFRATNALFVSVRKARGLPPPTDLPRHLARVLLGTILMIVTLAAALIVAVCGRRALEALSGRLYVSRGFIRLWTPLRFLLLGVAAGFMIATLYALAQGDGHGASGRQPIWPGVTAALASWLALSLLFSLYVEHAGRFSIIYGSIGTVIVLLLWLCLTATALIMGAEVNGALSGRGRDHQGGSV